MGRLRNYVRYAGGTLAEDLEDTTITHIVLVGEDPMKVGEVAAEVRRELATRPRLPRLVQQDWVRDCWAEKTTIDEELYAIQ